LLVLSNNQDCIYHALAFNLHQQLSRDTMLSENDSSIKLGFELFFKVINRVGNKNGLANQKGTNSCTPLHIILAK
jgi:hypothetical protein